MSQPAHRRLWSGLVTEALDAPVGLLGVPFDGAASYRKGAALAPSRIRSITPHIAPFTEEGMPLVGLRIRDYGDVPFDLDWPRYFASVRQLASTVLRHPFALFLGGDHSVTIPLVEAFDDAHPDGFGIIHIDAHTDLMDEFEGHQWSHACTARRYLASSHLDAKHVTFIGIRSWLQEEIDVVNERSIVVHSARRIYQRGIDAIVNDIVEQYASVPAIYLTLDIDCLDPAFAPGTGTPEAGGLTSRELLELLHRLFAVLPIRALDIVEVSPPLDTADITSMAAIKIIYEVLGMIAQ